MKKNKNLVILLEGAIMLALATILSEIKLFDAPFGGSITMVGTLPIALMAYRRGVKAGLSTAFVFSLVQLLMGLKNLSYAASAWAVIAIIVFDYIIPFTVLGVVGFFKSENPTRTKSALKFSLGLIIAFAARFLCHLCSGAVVWYELTKSWSAEDPTNIVFKFSAWTYSFIYNIAYMGPELIITAVVGIIVVSIINIQDDNFKYSK